MSRQRLTEMPNGDWVDVRYIYGIYIRENRRGGITSPLETWLTVVVCFDLRPVSISGYHDNCIEVHYQPGEDSLARQYRDKLADAVNSCESHEGGAA